MTKKKSLIVITWDGVSKPLEYILQDTQRNFDLLIFDHSAKASKDLVAHLNPEHFISTRTENKGQVFITDTNAERLKLHLQQLQLEFEIINL